MAIMQKVAVSCALDLVNLVSGLTCSPSADSSRAALRSGPVLAGECWSSSSSSSASSSVAAATTHVETNHLKIAKASRSKICGSRCRQQHQLLAAVGMSGGGSQGLSSFSAPWLKSEKGRLFEKSGCQQSGPATDCDESNVFLCCSCSADRGGTASTEPKEEKGASSIPKSAAGTAIGGVRKIGQDHDNEEDTKNGKPGVTIGTPPNDTPCLCEDVMIQKKVPDTVSVIKKTESYTTTMQSRMGGDLTYRHENGMNFARVLPQLIVGSCPQKPGDVDYLKRSEDVRTILCLQQDTDLAYFGVDLSSIQRRAAMVVVEHVRVPIRDFDPFDLRMKLPLAVAALHHALLKNGGTAYIHCTAGLGRAPAVALAYMYWVLGYTLEDANALHQRVRHCHPKLDAIREATADLLTDGSMEEVMLYWFKGGCCHKVEVAGLDVGWHNRIPMEYSRKDGRWLLRRNLPIGKYLYKYVVDGKWTYNPDAPLTKPDSSGNINNYMEVVGKTLGSKKWAIRQRVIRPGAQLAKEERLKVIQKLNELVPMEDEEQAEKAAV